MRGCFRASWRSCSHAPRSTGSKAVSAFAQGLDLDLKVIEQGVQRFRDYVALGHEMSDSAAVVKLYEHDAASRASRS
jgi:hypothetical protein